MSRPWSKEWFDDCLLVYGTVLKGRYRHWCRDLAGRPIDETCSFFHYCTCFSCKCGQRLEPKYYPWGRMNIEIHDDIWECPKRRFWNFWKHDWWNLIFLDKPNGRNV